MLDKEAPCGSFNAPLIYTVRIIGGEKNFKASIPRACDRGKFGDKHLASGTGNPGCSHMQPKI